MNNLERKSYIGIMQFQIFLGLLLFGSAGTFHYWQARLYWVVFTVLMFGIVGYLLKKDPALVERRQKAGPRAEKEFAQKVITAVAFTFSFATFMVPGLDFRFGWSQVPAWFSVVSDGFVILGYLFIVWVFRENTFASAVVEISKDQKVISTGPYAWVRHPMYSGALVAFLFTGPALGSWWGMVPGLLLGLSLGWRIVEEEKFLVKNLPGYETYRQKVRARLIPFVW